MAAMKAVDADAALKTLRRAHRFLVEDARVRAERTGVIGWCFGGAQSLRLGLAEPELDAVVMYYGHPITDPQALAPLRAPLLGIFGTRDQSIPPATVARFEEALKQAGKQHSIASYDAEHAFANPSNPRYDEKHASEAWERARAFLAQHLR
jgi:carboxymethylenebutenolidase